MAANLESVLSQFTARQEALEKRALADLHAAGFIQISSITDAFERLEAQRELPGFTQAQIDMVLYQRHSRERKGRAA